MTPKVFLGGTCNGSRWRDALIEMFQNNNIDYFNPVVDNWTSDSRRIEKAEKESSEYSVYVITPKMTGVYSIAEVIDDTYKKKDKCIFCVLRIDDGLTFEDGQERSLYAVAEMVTELGGRIAGSLFSVLEQIKLDRDRNN